ncbi:MAG: rod shape-determining protein, partial [Rhodocyclaceae bacterium]|nr:rod shape-determining protein [Rhodocyclaceae bacterium]
VWKAEAVVVSRIPGARHCPWEGAAIREIVAGQTGLPVIVADDPLTCVVRGSGLALEKMDKLGSIFANE